MTTVQDLLKTKNGVEANLSEANLPGANLYGAQSIICLYVPEMSSRGDYLYGIDHGDRVMFKVGCQWLSDADLLVEVRAKKGPDSSYERAINFILEEFKRTSK